METIRLRLLLIEDNPGDARYLGVLLSEVAGYDFDIVHVTRLQDGLGKLREDEFDAVLVDLGLPDSHGLDTFFNVLAEVPDVPILVLTGLDNEEIALRAVEAGAQDYLAKGDYSGPLIARAIRYAIERTQAELALRQSEERYRTVTELLSDYAYMLRVDEDGNLIREWVEGDFEEVIGYTHEEVTQLGGWGQVIHPDYHEAAVARMKKLLAGEAVTYDYRIIRKDGEERWLRDHSYPAHDRTNGKVVRIFGAVQDVTEVMRVRDSEYRLAERMQAGLKAGNLAWWEMSLPSGEVIFDARKAEMIGYPPDKFHHYEDFTNLLHPEDHDRAMQAVRDHLEGVAPLYEVEYRLRCADGAYKWFRDIGAISSRDEKQGSLRMIGLVQDIDALKQSEAMIEIRYELIDYSETHSMEELLQRCLVAACELGSSPIGFYHVLDEDGENLTYQVWSLSGSMDPEHVGLGEHLPVSLAGMWAEAIRKKAAVVHNAYPPEDGSSGMPAGHTVLDRIVTIPVIRESKVVALLGIGNKSTPYDQTTVETLSLFTDLTWEIIERKQNKDRLMRSLLEQRIFHHISSFALKTTDEDALIGYVTGILNENLYPDHVGILLYDERTDKIRVHPSYMGITDKEMGVTFSLDQGVIGRVVRSQEGVLIEDTEAVTDYISTTGQLRSEVCVPILASGKAIGAINAESAEPRHFSKADLAFLTTVANDVSIGMQRLRLIEIERQKLAEMAVQQNVNAALTGAVELETMLVTILENLQSHLQFESSVVFLKEGDYLNIVASKGIGKNAILPAAIPADEDLLFREIRETKSAVILEDAVEDERFQDYGDLNYIRGWMGIPLIEHGDVFGYATFDSRIKGRFTQENSYLAQSIISQAAVAIVRARLFDQTRRQVKRLEALHVIDKIITSSADLAFSLDEYLEIARSELEVDAAAVLVFDPDNQTLNYTSSQGFRTEALRYTRLPIGEGYAGLAAREQKTILVTKLDEADPIFAKSTELGKEQFKWYCSVPLISKGEVKGVLELFHRSLKVVDEEWERFLVSLAAQAAIAIENSMLFDESQKAILELSLGYDATLEGWARTLELRDQETEGHSQRVVEQTVRLARRMGLSLEQIIHARRGALLHDIGKIGIPDSILLKPGQLTGEEWEVMRQHPMYAYNALKEIDFLKKSLDIPYAHHEKWDGSGYPRGLGGEEIPMAARIFAVVDVFDALSSDRPYRKAWPRKKTVTYIKNQAGIHFDPAVVVAFLEMIRGEG